MIEITHIWVSGNSCSSLYAQTLCGTMQVKCGECKKVYSKISKRVAWRLRENHFCSQKCFSSFAKSRNYFLKRKRGPHIRNIEVLKMAMPQDSNRKSTVILKTEGGEEIDCLLIPKEEVESVLGRYV